GVGHTVALTRRLNVVDVAADDNLGSRRGPEIRDCAGRIHATRGGDDSEAGDHRGKQEVSHVRSILDVYDSVPGMKRRTTGVSIDVVNSRRHWPTGKAAFTGQIPSESRNKEL